MSNAIRTMRRALLHSIRRVIRPKLRESGFGCKLVCFVDANEWPESCEVSVMSLTDYRGTVVESIEGFTDDGVIVDAYGGGMVWQAWRTVCLEDLVSLERLIHRQKDRLM